jgi:DNA-directed RNA polymerase subunit K
VTTLRGTLGKNPYFCGIILNFEVTQVSETKLTRYERARIIGARALQISLGAPVLMDVDRGEPIDIALLELEKGVIPITVKRVVKGKQIARGG